MEKMKKINVFNYNNEEDSKKILLFVLLLYVIFILNIEGEKIIKRKKALSPKKHI